jgi:isopentenyl-diphosphate delta-isomerase
VHRLKLRHRAVHLLVANRAGQVFLHQRSLAKGPVSRQRGTRRRPGMSGRGRTTTARRRGNWRRSSAAGRPARRSRLFKVEAREETGQEFVWVYRVEAEGPFVLQPDEIARGGWFTVAEIDRWVAERPEELAPAFPLHLAVGQRERCKG